MILFSDTALGIDTLFLTLGGLEPLLIFELVGFIL
jgi:hypothetical protein